MAIDIAELVDSEGGTVSRRIFSEEDIYQLELKQVFARSWLFLAHESQVRNPGDFVTTYMAEDPIIVCRGLEGQIHAFLNSCMHRGNNVCRPDKGNAKSFMCPYHGWTYNTSGELVGVPGFKELYNEELVKAEWGLVPVTRVENYKGMIFGTWDEEAPPLEDYLGEIRWGMDILLDQRAGGTEMVGGIFKWIMNCNWKFAADNFIGDSYHGSVTHKSAQLAGHATVARSLDRRPSARKPASFAQNDNGFTINTKYGHGHNANVRPWEGDSEFDKFAEPLKSYYKQTAAEVEQRLGYFRTREVRVVACSVFPNLSLSSTTRMIHVWHPRGPNKTEVWLMTLVDKDAPVEIRDMQLLAAQRHFSPSGMFEVDDGENWEQSTLAARGLIARRHSLNYQIGLGHEEVIDDESSPPRAPGFASERNQRNFYRRWAQMMADQAWGGSLTNKT